MYSYSSERHTKVKDENTLQKSPKRLQTVNPATNLTLVFYMAVHEASPLPPPLKTKLMVFCFSLVRPQAYSLNIVFRGGGWTKLKLSLLTGG